MCRIEQCYVRYFLMFSVRSEMQYFIDFHTFKKWTHKYIFIEKVKYNNVASYTKAIHANSV